MSHERGQIVKSKDILNEEYYKVFTGCHYLDDFYTCDDYETALKISNELKQK